MRHSMSVSIRAPHFHAGRRRNINRIRFTMWFQSAPRIFMRGDRDGMLTGPFHTVSIRAPHFHAGRLRDTTHGAHRLHAPRFNAGRPAFSCGGPTHGATGGRHVCKFQSAPRIFMRGDASTQALDFEER